MSHRHQKNSDEKMDEESSSSDNDSSVVDESNPAMIMALDEIYQKDSTNLFLRKELVSKLIYYDTIMCTAEKDKLFSHMKSEADDYHDEHTSVAKSVCFRHVLHLHKEVLKGEIDKFIKSLEDHNTNDDDEEEDTDDETEEETQTPFSARFDSSYKPTQYQYR